MVVVLIRKQCCALKDEIPEQGDAQRRSRDDSIKKRARDDSIFFTELKFGDAYGVLCTPLHDRKEIIYKKAFRKGRPILVR